MPKTRKPTFIALLAALAASLALAAPAAADTFKPTRTDDPVANGCKPKNCSLREALIDANATAEQDSIRLGRGTYEMERAPQQGPVGASGKFKIVNPTILRGAGASKTRIDANRLDQALSIDPAGSAITSVRVTDLTIKGGYGTDLFDAGGGIAAGGPSAVTLQRVVVRDSGAFFGGGIAFSGFELTLDRSTVRGNEASTGGGLLVAGSDDRAPHAVVRASTFSGNRAGTGGGITAEGSPFFGSKAPTLEVGNSTVAGNHAIENGGGTAAVEHATVRLDNVTVTDNEADSDDAYGGDGGGIYQGGGASFSLGDSVVGSNTVGSTAAGTHQCAGTFSAQGGHIVERQAGQACSINNADDAGLGSLADNGGPTRTVGLRKGSPAIGFAVSCPPKDQRGKRRSRLGCDSGAFERGKP